MKILFHFLRRHCLAVFLMALLIVFSCPSASYSQVIDTQSVFRQPVLMDSFVLKSGFDVNAFIRRIRNDTTFFKAFKNLRMVPYEAVNDIIVLDKHEHTQASLHSNTKQFREKNCRYTKVTSEKTTGDFYDRHGGYEYYTAELFASLFFAPKPVCNESDIVAGYLDAKVSGGIEKSKYQLKMLIFNPGAKVSGIPFMGARASIFDEGEAEKYDFRITQEQYDGESCFVFRIMPKPEYAHKTLYNELTTWFRATDYSIVARDYSLSYNTMLYDFDVRMKVRTKNVGGKLFPTSIGYDGNWHIFTKKRERVRFTIEVTY